MSESRDTSTVEGRTNRELSLDLAEVCDDLWALDPHWHSAGRVPLARAGDGGPEAVREALVGMLMGEWLTIVNERRYRAHRLPTTWVLRTSFPAWAESA